MRFKESLALDRMIDERRASLLIDRDKFEMEKRAQALAVLIEARDRLDEIGARQEPEYRRYHKRFTGTAEDGRKIRPRRRRDQRRQHNVDDLRRNYEQRVGDITVSVGDSKESATTGREIAAAIRRELRRGDL